MEGGMEENFGWNMVEEGWRKGPWTAEEDRLLIEYVKIHGEGRWTSVAKLAGIFVESLVMGYNMSPLIIDTVQGTYSSVPHPYFGQLLILRGCMDTTKPDN